MHLMATFLAAESIATLQPVPNYAAWGQKDVCVNNLRRVVYESSLACYLLDHQVQ